MIDTHCHISSVYFDDIDKLINDIKQSGVNKIIVNGTDMDSNREVLRLVEKYDCVYGAIGFHPTELGNFNEDDLMWLEEHINDDKIVAVGEIGLDFHYEDTNMELQEVAFKKQLTIAQKYNKPVIIHSRDSIQETYNILKMFHISGSIHAYSGSCEMAKEFIKLGFCIGIGGISTFKNAKKIVDVIREIKLEYILLETDSPYLTPEPYRGKINTPSYIPIIADKVAEIKGLDVNFVAEITTKNAVRIFDF